MADIITPATNPVNCIFFLFAYIVDDFALLIIVGCDSGAICLILFTNSSLTAFRMSSILSSQKHLVKNYTVHFHF